jgi:hypothetical protein
MDHIKKFNESNSVEITIEEFQDIIDALTDARELVEDIASDTIIDRDKAEVCGEMVNNALDIMNNLASRIK